MSIWRIIYAVLGLWLTCVACAISTVAASTAVGTAIVNQATLSYVDAVTLETVELLSNTSSVLVAARPQFELRQPQFISVNAGERVVLVHQLINTGNVQGQYQLRVSNSLADNGDLLNLQLYVDSNANGVVDAAEPLIVGDLLLDPDAVINFIATGIAPGDQTGGDRLDITIDVQAVNTALPAQVNTDQITILQTSMLAVDLSSSADCSVALPADAIVNFELVVENTTDVLPQVKTVQVGAELRTGVLVQISIDENMALLAGEQLVVSGLSQPLIALQGNTDSWIDYSQWSGEQVPAELGLLIPLDSLAFGSPVIASFNMLVTEAATAWTATHVANIDSDSDGVADFNSNSTCTTLLAGGAAVTSQIRFIEPTVALQRKSGVPDFAVDADFTDAPVYHLYTDTELDSIGTSDFNLTLQGVYVELTGIVSSSQLIRDSSGADFLIVNVTSSLTGDSVKSVLRETATGSNVYRSIRPVLLSETLSANGAYCPASAENAVTAEPDYVSLTNICVLKSQRDDRILVSFVNQLDGAELSDTALVDPISRVFDSVTRAGVAGATVTLYRLGQVVLHPITGKAIVLITDATGGYVLPRLNAATDYSIGVDPPGTHVYPSTIAADKFEEFRVIDASYGQAGFSGTGSGRFAVSGSNTPPRIDIPVDPLSNDGTLLITKQSSVVVVAPGDVLSYSITLTNRSTEPLTSVVLDDAPDTGLQYLAGTARLDGKAIADPQPVLLNQPVLRGNSTSATNFTRGLRFSLPSMEADAQLLLTYRARVVTVADGSIQVNSAIARARDSNALTLTTAQVSAQIEVRSSGVMSTQATLFGKVYVDSSCDYLQNNGEWPVAGVRLYTNDGTYVVTDADGQYSLYGLQPGLYALRLDETSLPDALQLKPLGVADAADPGSRFINLSAGDFHRADFANLCPSADADTMFETLRNRQQALRNDGLLHDAIRFNAGAAAPGKDDRSRADTDGDLSRGVLGFNRPSNDATANAQHGNSVDAPVSPDNKSSQDIATGGDTLDALPENAVSDDAPLLAAATAVRMPDPKQVVSTITTQQAKAGTWLWPQDKLSRDGRFMVVVRAGVTPILVVNGIEVDASQIGEQLVNRRAQAQIVAWYGVPLAAGNNAVEVVATDAFGNRRVLAGDDFVRPTTGVNLVLRARTDRLAADGKSSLPIDILVTDEHDNPASGVYFVTLESSGGDFVEADLQQHEPGVQIRLENGRAKVHLISTQLTGPVRVRARTGALSARMNVRQVAASRPLIAVGLIDVGATWYDSDQPESGQDIEDGFNTDARISMFLNGEIRNNINLTMAYDSDNKRRAELLRNLNPNSHYATYGDSSLRGVEAQSTSKLYMKLENDEHSIMWGDYLTDSQDDLDNLAKVQRTLTGVNAVTDIGQSRMQVFAARSSTSASSEEVRGNGTALLYKLSGAPIVNNSEIVERIVRNRDNLGLVLSTERLQRHIDYRLDPQSGAVSFSDSIAAFDDELNPVFIRFSYDRADKLNEHTVAGVRLHKKISESNTVGASLTTDQNPLSGYAIAGIAWQSTIKRHTTFSVTAAKQRHNADRADGDAQRMQFKHNWSGRANHTTSLTWARASERFDSAAAGITAAQQEWRLEHRQPINNTLKFEATANQSRSEIEAVRLDKASVSVDKSFAKWSLAAGLSHYRQVLPARTARFNTSHFQAQRRLLLVKDKRASITAKVEADVSDISRNRASLASTVQLHKHVSAYARYETTNGLSALSRYQTDEKSDLFTAGIESDFLTSTQLYSEYRMKHSSALRSLETASGIRGRYEWRPGITISPTVELIDVRDNPDAEDAVALSLGVVDARMKQRKLAAQAELRRTSSELHIGFRSTFAQQLNPDWTALLREEFTRQTPDIGQLTSKHNLTVGFAHRPKRNNRYHFVLMANWKEDYGPSDGNDQRSYLLSTHQNLQLSPDVVLSGRLGSRWTRTKFDSGDQNTHVLLADARMSFDVNRRWEFDLRAGWLGTQGQKQGRYSYGFGLSWIVRKNLALRAHYNISGFRETHLDEQGSNMHGLNIGLQMKFDEDWFRWLE